MVAKTATCPPAPFAVAFRSVRLTGSTADVFWLGRRLLVAGLAVGMREELVSQAIAASGKTVSALAATLRVHRQTVSRWASGDSVPAALMLPFLEKALGLPAGHFLEALEAARSARRVTVVEAARMLGVSRPRVYQFIAAGRLEQFADGKLSLDAVRSMPRSTRGHRLKDAVSPPAASCAEML